MYRHFPICIFLLLFVPAGAQVASHAPTVFTQASPQNGPSSAPSAPNKPVARVNGSILTNADLVREEYAIFPYARQHNGVPKELEPNIRAGALKMIIFEELVYQEALHRKMTVPPVKVDHAEAEFRKQFSTPEEFNVLFQSEFHGSEQLLQQKIRRSLMIEGFLKNEVEDKGSVAQAEVRAFYERNPARFQHAETFTFQTISFLPPAKATPDKVREVRVRAEKALPQAKAAKTADAFGLLAEKISEDDYRVMMGQHKPVPADQLAPQVVKVLSSMKAGEVSDVIQVEQACTIIRLGEHSPAGMQKFDDVRAKLQQELELNKKNEIRSALDKRLRQNAKIEEL